MKPNWGKFGLRVLQGLLIAIIVALLGMVIVVVADGRAEALIFIASVAVSTTILVVKIADINEYIKEKY